MKKTILLISTLGSLFLLSCSKEASPFENSTKATPASAKIQGAISPETKTTYIEDGDSFQFNWKKGDKIAVQVVGDGVSQTEYNQLNYTADEGDVASSTFTTSSVAGWNEGDFAFYPKNQGAYVENLSVNRYQNELAYLFTEIAAMTESEALASATATVKTYETITEQAGLPMSHIPMIGYKTGEHEFSFKAPMGVLAITVNGLPSAAKSISISSDNYAMNGSFVFDSNYEIKESYCKDGSKSNTKTIVFPANGAASRTFYFPLPTGQMNGLTLIIKDMGGQTIFTKTSSVNITIARATVTKIPTLTFSSVVEWFNLGNGTYNDAYIIDNIFYKSQLAANESYLSDDVSGPVTISFQQNAAKTNLYRIANPYSVVAAERHYYQTQTSGREVSIIADPYLYVQVLSKDDTLPFGSLQAENDGEVWFGSGSTTEAVGNAYSKAVFSTGLYIDWGAVKGHTESAIYGEFILMHEDWHSSSTQYRYSKVTAEQSDIEIPATVQLAPYFKTRVGNTFTTFAQRNNSNDVITITFPVR